MLHEILGFTKRLLRAAQTDKRCLGAACGSQNQVDKNHDFFSNKKISFFYLNQIFLI